MQLRIALRQGSELLEKAGVGSPRLTAEVLLMHAAHCDRVYLYANAARQLTETEWIHYGRYLNERLQGKPTQYITGHQEFWGLDFVVNPSVLIPRPETELVVETAIRLAEKDAAVTIADVGTGSGCIAVALAKELPEAHIVAMDNSPSALETAQTNAQRHGVDSRIRFLISDLVTPRSGELLPPLNMVVSNPPYVSEADRPTLAPEVRQHEPEGALFAGQSGMEVYERLIPRAAQALIEGGYLVLELGYDVEERVKALLNSLQWGQIKWYGDLAGITRVVSANLKQSAREYPRANR